MRTENPNFSTSRKREEDGEDLPAAAHEQGKGVEEPVARAEDHAFFLGGDSGAGRIEEEACRSEGHDDRAHEREHGFVGKMPGAEEDEQRDGETAACGETAHAAHDQGSAGEVVVLDHERLIDGLEEVIARRHDEHRARDAPEGGEHADDGRAHAADDDGEHAEPVLSHDEHERHHEKAEKSRHFAQGHDEAVVRGGKAADFHGVVGVEEG